MIPEPLANGFCFGEGPRWFEGLLWFSDMLGEAVHTSTMRGSLTTLPLPGRSPSGLGFRPDGSLLIASTEDQQVLRYDGETVVSIADLADLAPANLGDMVIDDPGAPTSGPRRSPAASSSASTPTTAPASSAEDLDFPNGMVITPGRKDADRRRVDRPAADRVHHRRRTARWATGGSSPTAWTGRPTASRSTPRAGCGRR